MTKVPMEPVETESWSILIPKDWVEIKNEDDYGLNFESPDGSKAVCVIAEQLSDEKSDEIQLKELMEIERTEMKALEGYNFAIVKDSVEKTASGAAGYLEAYDEKELYRIVCKVLVSNGELVQFNYDDYECSDLKISTEYSKDILASATIKE